MKTRIISMCTYSYNKWIPSFYNSIRAFNPKIKITIYLINYPKDKIELLKEWFPDVDFIERNGEFPLKQTYNVNKDAYLVTFLKGEFVNDATTRYKDNVLWIDITSLIRTDLKDVNRLINKNDVVLIQRDPKITEGTRAFAAEIFGFNNKAKDVIKQYYDSCEKLKTLWYADQLSLCNLKTEKKGYLEFQVFCNFYYDQEARTWSDRGKKGVGKIEVDDADYTLNKYADELEKYVEEYTDGYEYFIEEFKKPSPIKPKILVFLDDDKWCYYTTAMEVVKRLKDEFEFTVVRNLELDLDKAKAWEGDLIWARCGAYRAVKILYVKPAYKDKIITTITTGGINAKPVVERHIRNGWNHIGVFTQNTLTEDLLRKYGFNNEIYNIANGVDIDRFKPVTPPNKFIVGFAGRKADAAADKTKGYSEFFKPACENLGVLHRTADSQQLFIPHEEIHKYYQSLSVLLQPSAHEGCSNTIMEAMSTGLPCIIVKTGYHGEVCEHKKNVYFVERDLEQIENAIIELRDNPRLYKKISEGARKFAEEHSWDIQAEKVKQSFKKLLYIINNK